MTANVPLDKVQEAFGGAGDTDIGRLWTDNSPEALLDYVKHFFTIADERAHIVPFIPNPMQELLAFEETGRDITVKARQTGTTSWKLARRVRRMTNGELTGANCLVAADKDASTIKFREKIRHHLEDLKRHGFDFKLKHDSDKEMVIGEFDNRFIFASGEQRHIARSYSAQEVHLSEFAHWPEESAKELVGEMLPAVPPPPYGNVDIESTPAGDSGKFYELAIDYRTLNGMPGNVQAEWNVHFHPWWVDPRYRAAQTGSDVRADLYLTTDEYESMRRSFAPSDIEARLMRDNKLTLDQILWRRITKFRQDKTDVPFLQEFPEDFETCWIGVEGRFFDTPDQVDHLEHYRNMRADPIFYMEKLAWKGAEITFFGQNLALWETPRPGGVYVVWGDAAGGSQTKDSDYTCINVWDAVHERIVARCRLKCSPKHAGAVACAIGGYYNTALAGFERSQHGETALEEMKELAYPNIYMHIPAEGLKKGAIVTSGIYPTPQNRQRALSEFKEGITYHRITSFDPIGSQEMSQFTWQRANKRLKAQAAEGQHDDWIMASAWGYYVLDKARMRYTRAARQRDEEIVVDAHGVIQRNRRPRASQQPWFR